MTQKHPDYPKSRAEAFHNLVAEDEGRAGGMVEKYRRFVVGERGLGFLFLYEILTLAGDFQGRQGFAARRVCYRPLLGSQGRGTIFGRNLTLRHPKRLHWVRTSCWMTTWFSTRKVRKTTVSFLKTTFL